MVGCRGLLLRDPGEGWAEQTYPSLLPGAPLVVVGPLRTGLQARRVGLELRDTLLVLRPGLPDFAFLFRRPPEGTVAENVLRFGCGGLNVDACRVGTAAGIPSVHATRAADESRMTYGNGLRRAGSVVDWSPGAGRWPSNLVLVHHAECREAGTRRVPNVGGSSSGGSAFGQNSGWNPHNNRVTEVRRNRDSDGLETIRAYECHETCPVRALDEQSGVLSSAMGRPHTQDENHATICFNGRAWSTPGVNQHGDTGGASRFFPQFKDEVELDGWLRRLMGIGA